MRHVHRLSRRLIHRLRSAPYASSTSSALVALRVALALAVALAAGCGAVEDDEGASTVLVSAAASLTDAFADVEAAFEAAHPGVDVVLNLAGSSALRTQILEGAPADVFASADVANMDALLAAGEVEGEGEPVVFATNRLALVVPAGNPGDVRGLADLAREELLVGLCAAEVPCGAVARRALTAAGVTPATDTEEPDVRALLTRVALGELDVGVVYRTDVAAAGPAVESVAVRPTWDAVTAYPIAVLAGAPNRAAARAFVDFVLSPEGQSVLARHGFGPGGRR